MRMRHRPAQSANYISLLALALLAGCQSTATLARRDATHAQAAQPTRVDAASVAGRDPRGLAIYDARRDERIDWTVMIARINNADVIVLGEQHDDGVAHATQLAVVQDVAEMHPNRGALSMEMLERDDQAATDDYIEGLMDATAFAKTTSSTDWAGEGSWAKWYQPIIDAAVSDGWTVIAANAPRRYLRIARSQGYERLAAMPPARRELIAIPKTWPAAYRQRFIDVMNGMGGEDEEDDEGGKATTQPATQPDSPPTSQPATQPDAQPASQPSATPAHGPMKPEDIDPAFRGQLLWDATMADSIARASRGGAKPVVHLVGQFHCDFAGGTVQELRARLGPKARIVTISMQRGEGATLRERDHDRADFVIYTGKRPPKAEPSDAN